MKKVTRKLVNRHRRCNDKNEVGGHFIWSSQCNVQELFKKQADTLFAFAKEHLYCSNDNNHKNNNKGWDQRVVNTSPTI